MTQIPVYAVLGLIGVLLNILGIFLTIAPRLSTLEDHITHILPTEKVRTCDNMRKNCSQILMKCNEMEQITPDDDEYETAADIFMLVTDTDKKPKQIYRVPTKPVVHGVYDTSDRRKEPVRCNVDTFFRSVKGSRDQAEDLLSDYFIKVGFSIAVLGMILNATSYVRLFL